YGPVGLLAREIARVAAARRILRHREEEIVFGCGPIDWLDADLANAESFRAFGICEHDPEEPGVTAVRDLDVVAQLRNGRHRCRARTRTSRCRGARQRRCE